MSKSIRRSAQISADNVGEMLVQIIRKLFSDGATIAATGILEEMFSSDRTPEEIIQLINDRGLEFKIYASVEVPGDENVLAVSLGTSEESITVNPGLLKSAEVEPAQAAVDDD